MWAAAPALPAAGPPVVGRLEVREQDHVVGRELQQVLLGVPVAEADPARADVRQVAVGRPLPVQVAELKSSTRDRHRPCPPRHGGGSGTADAAGAARRPSPGAVVAAAVVGRVAAAAVRAVAGPLLAEQGDGRPVRRRPVVGPGRPRPDQPDRPRHRRRHPVPVVAERDVRLVHLGVPEQDHVDRPLPSAPAAGRSHTTAASAVSVAVPSSIRTGPRSSATLSDPWSHTRAAAAVIVIAAAANGGWPTTAGGVGAVVGRRGRSGRATHGQTASRAMAVPRTRTGRVTPGTGRGGGMVKAPPRTVNERPRTARLAGTSPVAVAEGHPPGKAPLRGTANGGGGDPRTRGRAGGRARAIFPAPCKATTHWSSTASGSTRPRSPSRSTGPPSTATPTRSSWRSAWARARS